MSKPNMLYVAGNSSRAIRIRRTRMILALCLFELLMPLLVIFSYLNDSFSQMIIVVQIFIFLAIVALTQKINTRMTPIFAVLMIMIAISIIKTAIFGDVLSDNNFTLGGVGPYFFSILMPCMVFISIFSIRNVDLKDLQTDLIWFARYYLIFATVLILIYSFFRLTGQITYFGLGLNFHYFAPYFFQRYTSVLFMIILVMLTGKRAVALNFIIQFALYSFKQIFRSPTKLVFLIFTLVICTIFGGHIISPFLGRYALMFEAFSSANFSDGLLSLANSYEAIVLFGGRLEEVVGVIQYFEANPGQIWFGSPPGANYVWTVEQSDYVTVKSYAHFTWLGYIFRYGIIPTIFLIAFFVRIATRYVSLQNPLWLVFIGTLISATFGANLFYSPTAWVMIALYARFSGATIDRRHKNFTSSNRF